MGCPVAMCVRIYRPRQPRESPLYRLLDRHDDEFERVYDQRYRKRYGFWRLVIAELTQHIPGHGKHLLRS